MYAGDHASGYVLIGLSVRPYGVIRMAFWDLAYSLGAHRSPAFIIFVNLR